MNAFKRLSRSQGLWSLIFRTSVTNIAVLLLTTGISILTARMFGVEGKGEFSTILFWPTFMAGLSSFGLPSSIIYNVKRQPEHTSLFIRVSLQNQLICGVIVSVVAWFGIPHWIGHYDEAIIRTAQYFAIATVPVTILMNLIAAIAQSLERFKIYNGIRLYVPLCNIVGLMVLWACGQLSMQMAALVYFLTTMVVVLWCLLKLRQAFFGPMRDLLSKRLFLLYQYGMRVYGTELLGTLSNQADKVVIISFLSAREFGLYSVVYALSRLFNTVQIAIANIVFPKVSGQEHKQVIRTVGQAFRVSSLLMLLILVPSMIIGRFLLGLLFGHAFLEASMVFYLLCIECVIGGSSWILASSFNAIGRPGLVFIRQFVALSITIGLFFVLTPWLGLNGIALSMLIGAVIRLLFSLAYMRTIFQIRMMSLLYDKQDWQFVRKMLEKLKVKKGERQFGTDS